MSELPVTATQSIELIGRKSLSDGLLTGVDEGRHAFALEGISGVGKSALLACVVEALSGRGYGTAHVNAGEHASEDLAIATIYSQLKALPQDPQAVVDALGKRLALNGTKILRELAGAIAADIVKAVTDKAGKTIDVVQKVMAGNLEATAVGEALDQLEFNNKRMFLTQFLGALADTGTRVVISIDNVDQTNLSDFIRFLLLGKPASLLLLLAHNTERGDNILWDGTTALVKASKGLVVDVQPLTDPDIAMWFHRAFDRWPSETELRGLREATGGRPYGLEEAFEAIRNGVDAAMPDYSGFYSNRRQAITGDARAVAELLAIIPHDAYVSVNVLATAAATLGAADIGSALDRLRQDRLLKGTADALSLAHSLAQDTWRAGLTGPRRAVLEGAWLAVYRQFKAQELTGPDAMAIIPIIVTPLGQALPAADLAQVGAQLVSAGQLQVGLELIDRVWKFETDAEKGGEDMVQQALLAARIRLELGRYNEVNEPLIQAEHSTNPETRIEALLLRMKLALRQNTYVLLWALAEKLDRVAEVQPKHRAASQATLNVAYRDILNFDGIRQTTDRLVDLRDSLAAEQQISIDRSIARALAKLNDLDLALLAAERALDGANEIGTVRDLGNAYLARAEVRRYRREYPQAVEDYRRAEEIGRGMGNRDSQLWSLLGTAAAQIESGRAEAARAPLDQVAAILAEPGYEHPIETAHADLLKTLAGDPGANVDRALSTYDALGIAWPRSLLESFGRGEALQSPTPL